jgi:hypothetical protein
MTQEQKKTVQEIFKNNPTVDTVFINPRGKFFTDESYALNSLTLDTQTGQVGQLKSVKRKR